MILPEDQQNQLVVPRCYERLGEEGKCKVHEKASRHCRHGEGYFLLSCSLLPSTLLDMLSRLGEQRHVAYTLLQMQAARYPLCAMQTGSGAAVAERPSLAELFKRAYIERDERRAAKAERNYRQVRASLAPCSRMMAIGMALVVDACPALLNLSTTQESQSHRMAGSRGCSNVGNEQVCQ